MIVKRLERGRKGDLGIPRRGGWAAVPRELGEKYHAAVGQPWYFDDYAVGGENGWIGPVAAAVWRAVDSSECPGSWAVSAGMPSWQQQAHIGGRLVDGRENPAYTWAWKVSEGRVPAYILATGQAEISIGTDRFGRPYVRILGPKFPLEWPGYRWAWGGSPSHFPEVGRKFRAKAAADGETRPAWTSFHDVPGLGIVEEDRGLMCSGERVWDTLSDTERLEIQGIVGIDPSTYPVPALKFEDGLQAGLERPWDIFEGSESGSSEYLSEDERGWRTHSWSRTVLRVRPLPPASGLYEDRGHAETVGGIDQLNEADPVSSLVEAALNRVSWIGCKWASIWTNEQKAAWRQRTREAAGLDALAAEARERLAAHLAAKEAEKAAQRAAEEAERARELEAARIEREALYAAQAAEKAAAEAARIQSGEARKAALFDLFRDVKYAFPEGKPPGYQVADGFPLHLYPSPAEAFRRVWDAADYRGAEAWGQEIASWPEGTGPWGKFSQVAREARKLPRK